MLADSSFIISLDRRKKLGLLEKYAKRNQIKIHVTPHVKEEIIDQPREDGIYADSVNRIEKLFGDGLIVVVHVDYTIGEVSTFCDNVRMRIAESSGKELHKVERADCEIAALACQLSITTKKKVRVVFKDNAMREALESVISGRGHQQSIGLVDSDAFVAALK